VLQSIKAFDYFEVTVTSIWGDVDFITFYYQEVMSVAEVLELVTTIDFQHTHLFLCFNFSSRFLCCKSK